MTLGAIGGTLGVIGGSLGGDVPRDEAFAAFDAAVANRDSAPVKIVCVGDSVTEYAWADTVMGRWTELMGEALRDALPVSGDPRPVVPQYIPVWFSQTELDESGLVTRSAGTLYEQYGLGAKNVRMDQVTNISFAVTGTSFDFVYTRSPSASTVNVSWDGGSATAVNYNGTANPHMTQHFDMGSGGAHTVTLARTAGNAQVNGIRVYNGDETKGFHVLNAGNAGWKASDAADQLFASNMAANVAPHLVIIMLGINDRNAGVDPAEYKTDIEATLTIWRNATPDPSFLLVAPYEAHIISPAYDWADYVTALEEIADAASDVAFLDLGDEMPAVAPGGGGYYEDSLHPNASGHALLASLVADKLTAGL